MIARAQFNRLALAGLWSALAVTSFAGLPERREMIASDDFDRDLTQWVVEQTPSGTTALKNGHLEIDDGAGPHDKGGCTVWFKRKFAGPLLIEFTVTMIQRGGPNDRVSDLNCFWMATDPRHPDDLFAGSAERAGSFAKYDGLQLYYVGYGANGNTTTRFRRYPGDGSRPLDPGNGELRDQRFMNVPNQPVKFQVVADGNRVAFFRDGEAVFALTDPQPFRDGWFGFRTVRNHMTIDHFRVYRIGTPPGPQTKTLP